MQSPVFHFSQSTAPLPRFAELSLRRDIKTWLSTSRGDVSYETGEHTPLD
jgi:hypothetical protein